MLSCITAEACFFHDEEKAFKKMNELIDKMHPDNYQQVQHALTIAYKGIQIGIASFYKNIQKALIKHRMSYSLIHQLRITLSNSLSTTHGILYSEVYKCASAAENKMKMFYVAQSSNTLYEKLTIHDKLIVDTIFDYFTLEKNKNEYIILMYFGKYSYTIRP